jgi:hypothetical protein
MRQDVALTWCWSRQLFPICWCGTETQSFSLWEHEFRDLFIYFKFFREFNQTLLIARKGLRQDFFAPQKLKKSSVERQWVRRQNAISQ